MRATLLTTTALIALSACHFDVDRTVSPGEIRGTLVFTSTSGTNVPVRGAHVALEDSNLSAEADSQGNFSFRNLPPGTYAITVTASQAGNGIADSGVRLQGITLAAIAGGAINGLDLGTIEVGAFGDIAGSVTQGSATDGAVVTLTGIAQTIVAGGKFAFKDLGPGDYSVALYLPGESGGAGQVTSPVAVHVVPRTSSSVSLDLTLATTVSGSIQGLARLAKASTNQGVSVILSGPTATTSVTNNAAGEYVIPQLSPGVYTITAHAMGYEDVAVPFVVVGGTTTNVPPITLTTYSVPLPDGGIETDAEHIAAACGEMNSCGALAPFPSESQCESVCASVLTQLELDTACNPAADSLSGLLDCLATSPCEAFAGGAICAEQQQQFTMNANLDQACVAIAAALMAGQITGSNDGGNGDGGACGDTTSNPMNCGSCGHVCAGAPAGASLACEFGACIYTRAVNQPNAEPLLVDSTSLYWLTQGSSGSNIMTVPLAGGLATTLGTLGMNFTSTIAQDADNIYWGTFSAIVKQPKSGGSATTLASFPSSAPWQSLTDSTTLYWTDEGSGIYSLPLTGGVVSTLVSNVSAQALAADSANLYWSDSTTNAIVTASKAGGTPTTLTTVSDPVYGITVDNGFIYWATYMNPGVVEKIGVTGGSPVTLSNGGEVNQGQGIVVQGSYVYWSNFGSGTVYGAPTSGTGTAFRVTAEQANPPCLAVDSSNLYWSTSTDIVSTPLLQ